MAKNRILILLPRLKGILLLFFLSIYFYVLAGKIDIMPTPGQLGPAFWPRVALILLMMGCGIKCLEIFFSLGKEAKPQEGETPPPAVNHLKLYSMIGLVILVVVAMDNIGFLLANLLFLIFFMWMAGMRKKLPLLLISTVGTILLLYLFVKVVYLPLPKGHWFFEDMTIFIYRILGII
jgi:hypothetical protein